MTPAKAKAKAKQADPNRLARGESGTYRTEDGRFEVRDGGTGWFVSDTARTNDFGQDLILGPYPTLKVARAALADLRDAKVTPLRRPAKAPSKQKPAAKPKPKPKSWIDHLSKADAAEVRLAIAALERAGLTDADTLVRKDRDGLLPAIATRLIERELDALADELPEPAREGARALIRQAAEILTASGASQRKGLPGWTLVEIGPHPEPPNRRITVR